MHHRAWLIGTSFPPRISIGSFAYSLGCVVLLCLVCMTLLASSFLPSHLSLKHVIILSRLYDTVTHVVSYAQSLTVVSYAQSLTVVSYAQSLTVGSLAVPV